MKISFNTFENSGAFTTTDIQNSIDKFKASERFDFINTLNEKSLLEECKDAYEKFKDKKHFVQVGIGGSSLGPEMLIKAINRNGVKFHFLNNVDTDHTIETLNELDLKSSLFYIVSKSGGTAETMAQMAIVVNLLAKNGVSEDQLKDYFVFATDPVKSELKELGEELGITLLKVPTNVGGRFSVLTPVGLLPALFAGYDCDKLLSNAHQFATKFIDSEEFSTVAQKTLNLYTDKVDQTVLMPYSTKLREMSYWFVQLWAESLGKKQEVGGKVSRIGLTPIPSYGATDQHSQMQLFMEGPRNKLLFMLHVNEVDGHLPLENNFKASKLQKLNKFSLKNLMDAEFFGTLKALTEQEIHHIHLEIGKVNEEAIGELILFFELLTAICGYALKIDPFNQPGVEAGKVYSFEWLDKLAD